VSILRIIGKVAGEDARTMAFVEDHHVLQTLTADTAHEPLATQASSAAMTGSMVESLIAIA
jgi:hypothetical protein